MKLYLYFIYYFLAPLFIIAAWIGVFCLISGGNEWMEFASVVVLFIIYNIITFIFFYGITSDMIKILKKKE